MTTFLFTGEYMFNCGHTITPVSSSKSFQAPRALIRSCAWLCSIGIVLAALLLSAQAAHAAAGAWPQASHDGRRTCYSEIPGIDNPGLVPIFPEDQEPFSDEAEGSILIGPHDIFVLRDGYYPGDHIAFDKTSNSILWSYPRSNVDQPAIGPDGTVYVYGPNREPTALDPDTGTVLWQDSTVAPALALNWLAAPVIDANGNSYFQIDGGFAVYEPGSTRKLLWKYTDQYTGVVYNPKGFAVGGNGSVYFLETGSLQFLYAVDADTPANQANWYFSLSDYYASGRSPLNSYPLVGSDGTIYVRHYEYVLAVTDKGTSAELAWKTKIEDELAGSGGVSPVPPPVLDDAGYLYVWSMLGDVLTLHCLDTNSKGSIVWTKTISGEQRQPDSILGAGGRLYVLCGGTDDGALYAVDMASGEIEFTRGYTGLPSGEMAIASDGTIYYTAYYYARDGHYYSNHTIMALGQTTNTPPDISRLAANPSEGNPPLTVIFSTTATDFDGDSLTYHWDFGDGQTSTEEDPSHTFTEPGTYEVTLTVTDAQGASVTETITITVYEQELPPGSGGDNQTETLSVSISAAPRSGRPPLEVSFEAVPSHTYQNMTYSWTFGDGASGSGKTVSHTYTAAGAYTVSLTVRSTYQTATASTRINVTAEGREVIGFDCLTIEADTLTCPSDDTCTLSGNVMLNGFVASSDSVTVVGDTVSGSGSLSITTDDNEVIDLTGDGFTITADAEDDDGNCYARIDTGAAFSADLFGFDFEYEGMSLYEDHVIAAGSLKLPLDFGNVRITVTYSTEGIDFGGRIELPDIQIAGFGVKDGYLELDTFLDLWEIGATLKVPGLQFEIGAELGILGGYLNMVKVEVGNINKPILYSPPPAPAPIVFLQSVNGGLDNISPEAQDPVVFSAGAGFTGGPEITLPSLNLLSGRLKVAGGDYAILGGDIDLEIDTGGRFTAEGTGYLLSSDFGTFGNFALILDIQRGVYFSGTLYYPPGESFAVLVVTGQGKIDFGFNFQASLQGTMKTPDAWWLIGGKTFGSAKAYIDNDLIAAGVQIGDRICIPLVGCANLVIKVSVTFDFDEGDFTVARNWDTIGEVTFSQGRVLSMAGSVAAQVSGSRSFVIDDNETAVIFRLEAQGGQASFTLEGPDKTVYDPSSGNAFWSSNDTLGEVWCAVPSPLQGTWNMSVSSSAKSYTTQLLRQNREPALAVTGPGQDIAVKAGETVAIAWQADDPDDNAEVSLFYDEDRQGEDGVLIRKGLPEQQSAFSWNTTAMPPGRYYIYAKADDGKNTPVISYGRYAVTIIGNGLSAPAITAVAQGPAGLSVAWSAVEGAAGYRVYYGSARDSLPLRQCPSVAVWEETAAALHHLDWGRQYRVAVTAFDQDGVESDFSDALEAAMENREGNNAPVITSRPAPLVQEGQVFTYQITAQDADRDMLSYGIQEGPGAMTVSALGLVSWTPQEEEAGTHRVTLRVADSDNASDEQTFYLSVLSSQQNIAEPFAAINCSGTVGEAPLSVSFSAIVHDIRGEAFSFLWDFGDGETSTEQNPEHVFREQGFYTVQLIVNTATGLQAEAGIVVQATGAVQTIEPPAVTPAVSGSQVRFSVAASGNVQGTRFFIGSGGSALDYEHPVDLGAGSEFSFFNIPPGVYLTVFRSYLAETGETWDSAKKLFTVVSPAKAVANLPTGVLEGKVLDAASGEPVAGALVRFVFYRARTDAEGNFRFENLPDIRKAYVAVSAANYLTAYQAVAIQQGASTTCSMQLAAGSDNQTCPAAQYLPEHATDLRAFRDRVLERNAQGRQVIRAYYAAAPELIMLLKADAVLRGQTLVLARELLPVIQKAARGEKVLLSPALRKKIKETSRLYRKKAGGDLTGLLDAVDDFLARFF